MVATRRILVTGCSGGGKSSLIGEMARRGWAIVMEPGRRVIAQERASGGDALPWVNMQRFAEACADIALRDWQGAQGITLFDRGLPDACLALQRLGKGADFAHLMQDHRYDRTVILAPPWPELFASDADRRHGFAEAVAEYENIAAALPRLGYDTRELPRISVAKRADWLENWLQNG